MFSLSTYTLIHVVFSLVGIASGLVVVLGLIAGKRLNLSNALFLGTTVADERHRATASRSTISCRRTSSARSRWSSSPWRSTRATRVTSPAAGGRPTSSPPWRRSTSTVFVLVVQAFLRVPALNALAPTQSEPPFAVAQLAVLVLFIVLGSHRGAQV